MGKERITQQKHTPRLTNYVFVLYVNVFVWSPRYIASRPTGNILTVSTVMNKSILNEIAQVAEIGPPNKKLLCSAQKIFEFLG